MSEEKKLNLKDNPLFMIDSSVLIEILEGNEQSNEMASKLFEMKKHGVKFKAVTFVSSFFNAIWKANPDKVDFRRVQETMELLNIGFHVQGKGLACFEYKNEKLCMDEIIDFANAMNKAQKKS